MRNSSENATLVQVPEFVASKTIATVISFHCDVAQTTSRAAILSVTKISKSTLSRIENDGLQISLDAFLRLLKYGCKPLADDLRQFVPAVCNAKDIVRRLAADKNGNGLHDLDDAMRILFEMTDEKSDTLESLYEKLSKNPSPEDRLDLVNRARRLRDGADLLVTTFTSLGQPVAQPAKTFDAKGR